MDEDSYKTTINEIRMEWITSPPYLNSMGIIIAFSSLEKCPNRCPNKSLICDVYNEQKELIDKIPNPVSTEKVIEVMINSYFPQIQIGDETRPNLDSKHVNIIVFNGDFMIQQNFEFISDLFEKLQKLKVGMMIATETIGSSNKEALPFLLSQKIIDSVTVNLGVYPQWDDNISEYASNALNSLTQCIDAKTHGQFLEKIGISFLFDQYSSIDVFEEYLRIIYDAYKENEEDLYDEEFDFDSYEDRSVYSHFSVYLRGDGTEKKGILESAYKIAVKLFVEHKIKKVPIIIHNERLCIFCQT